MKIRKAIAVLGLVTILGGSALAAGPYPPYPPYPPPPPPPPPRVVDPNPPPLSPVMRVIYAPFYAAGLVVRYGFYYVVIAPIEVFSRTIAYGVEGGVERPPPRRPPPSSEPPPPPPPPPSRDHT